MLKTQLKELLPLCVFVFVFIGCLIFLKQNQRETEFLDNCVCLEWKREWRIIQTPRGTSMIKDYRCIEWVDYPDTDDIVNGCEHE